MPKRDSRYMDEQREKILVAALREFATHGLQRGSMSGIARRLGISVGTLYIHFKNREDVVKGIFDRHMARYPVLPNATFTEMRAIIRETWSRPVDAEARQELALSAHLISEAILDPKVRRAIQFLAGRSLRLFEGGVGRDPALRHLALPVRRELAKRLYHWWHGLAMFREDKLGANNSRLLRELEAGFDLFIDDALRR